MTLRGGHAAILWRRKALVIAIAYAFAAGQAQANGVGPTVVAGQASIQTAGSVMTITNSPGAIVNWQGFSIASGETTRFIQQSATSSILNRVIGADPSLILGTLTSNGRVFLINPSGIMVGAGARIDVAGLIASTLNLSNQDFLANRLNFTANPLAGKVENQGSITTPGGGSVYLVGSNVSNSGIITSPQGDVILAAGNSVKILDSSTPGVRVELTASDNTAVNLGRILGQSGQVGIYGAALRNSGVIDADQVMRDASGRIVLRAKQDVILDAGSRLSVNGEQAGSITVQSEAGTTLVSGTVAAKGVGEQAGTGGTVQVLGERVGLIAAKIDASGTAGGGTVLVGGDFQGRNPSVQNAAATYVSVDTSINADALASGNGGKVIVWADGVTRFRGEVSARGGVQRGDGGFTEVSGKRSLEFGGLVDLRATNGKTGTLLLDPLNITIQGAGPNLDGVAPAGDDLASPNILFADFGSNNSVITSVQVVTQLATADVTLQATNDITVNAGIDASGNATGRALSLQAGHDVVINAALTTSSAGGGSLILSAGNNVTVGAALTANGGSVSLIADSDGTGPGLAGGTVSFGAITAANLSIRFNPVDYTTTTSEIATYAPKATLTGTFDARAWTFVDNASATAQNKTYDATTVATLDVPFSLKSAPDGVTVGQRVGLTAGNANFDSKNVSATTVNFTGYGLVSTLASADVNLYALFSQPASQTASISAKALTITGFASDDKTYNANTTAVISNAGSLTGIEAGDTVGFSNTGATFDTRNVGAGKTVTLNGVTLTGTGDETNYSYLAPTTDLSAISAKALTITGFASDDKTYNANTTAVISNAGSLTGIEAGDTVGFSNTGATFDTRNVGAGKTVTLNGVTLTGTGDETNYSYLAPTTDLSAISAKALTITGFASDDKTYNANTTAVISNAGSLTGIEAGDTVGFSNTGATFDTRNVGAGKTVTLNGVTLTGTGDETNYSYLAPTTDLSAISAKALTITGFASDDKTYNANTTAVISNAGSLTGIEAGDTVGFSNTGATFDTRNVGAGKTVTLNGVTLTGTGDETNYSYLAPTTDLSAISAKALTITGFASDDKTYNANTTAVISNAGSLTGIEAGDTVGFSNTGATFDTRNVGAGKTVTLNGVTLTGTGDETNYSYLAPTTDLSAISAKALTITGFASDDKTYNANTTAVISNAGSLTGIEAGDTVGFSNTGATFDTRNVGAGKTVTLNGVTLTGTGDETNYSYLAPTTDLSAISAKALTITGFASDDKTYNANTTAVISNAGSLTGIEAGDTVGFSNTGATFDTRNVGAGKTVTLNGVTLTGTGDETNYSYLAPTTDLSAISAKALTITGFASDDKTYNANTTAVISNAGSLTGIEAGDTVGFSNTGATFDTRNVGAGKTVTLNGVTLTGTGDETNYSYLAPTTDLSAISAKALTITGFASDDKTYNANTTAVISNAGSLTGIEAGDTVGFSNTGATFDTRNVGAGKTVTLNGVTLTGTGDETNYSYLAPTTDLSAISAKALTITGFASDDKTYNANTTAVISNAGSLTGIEAGDTVGFSNTGATFDTRNVGAGKTVTLNGVTLTGTGDETNYSYLAPTTDLSAITTAMLTIVADAGGKGVGTPDPALGYTTGAFQPGDSAASVLGGALSRMPGEGAGTYAITLGSLTAGSNYTLGFTGNDFIIVGTAVVPVWPYGMWQATFSDVLNNQTYYRPGNFWHVSLNINNADPGFDVMRGTEDGTSRRNRRMNSCDSVFGGGFCETWSFPQQRTRDEK